MMDFDFSYLDFAFKNGKVITVNASDEIAQAVGVKGNRIAFVGTDADIEQIIDEKTRVIEMKLLHFIKIDKGEKECILIKRES